MSEKTNIHVLSIAIKDSEQQAQLVSIDGNKTITTSLLVATVFDKEHKDVLKAIRNLGCSEDFNQRNFAPVDYLDAKGEKRPAFNMTKDGFAILAMGFTGEKAMQFKEAYIAEFNRMEKQLKGYKPEPTPQDHFIKNHKAACLLFKDRTSRLRYANQLTLEQTGFDVMNHAGLYLPEQNPVLNRLLSTDIDGKTIQQLCDAVHYQRLDAPNAKTILSGLWLRVHQGKLYIGNRCPFITDRKTLQDTPNAVKNACVYMNNQTTRATIINLY